jgi:hypothetical protein
MGYKTQSILSMPIKDNEGEVIGVAQAINKVTNRNQPFTEHDEKVCKILKGTLCLRNTYLFNYLEMSNMC